MGNLCEQDLSSADYRLRCLDSAIKSRFVAFDFGNFRHNEQAHSALAPPNGGAYMHIALFYFLSKKTLYIIDCLHIAI